MKRNIFKRISTYVIKSRFLFIMSVICAIASSAIALYLPFVFGAAIDEINGFVNMSKLIPLLIKAGIAIAIEAISLLTMNLANNKITGNVSRTLRNELANKLNKLTISYLDTHSTGETASKIIYDVDKVSEGLLMGLTQVFCGIITILGTICFMFIIRWQIALLVIFLTPLSLFIARFISKKTYIFFKKQSEINGEMMGFTNETIENQKTIHSFSGARKNNYSDFKNINDRLKVSSLYATFFSSLVNPTTRVVNNVIYAFVALVGALLVVSLDGLSITVGGLTSLLAYASQYAKPFNEISGVVTEMESSIASAERIFELLDAEEISSDENTLITNVKGNVDFSNIDFSYTNDNKLIQNFNLHISPGMRVAIVGPTGCGKTTIINLLMRFYDIQNGKITIDGVNIKDIPRNNLRSSFGMVLQDTWIRYGTVLDNIRIGKPNATREEAINASIAAFADSFIRKLPDGYDTIISPSYGLSEGEKQLLCIARIMLTNPSMLILDEATSSIDLCTEVEIKKAFNSVMEGKTSIIIAHRLSTIMDCDLIVVMKNGCIVEKGTHNELISLNGFYSDLYKDGTR